MLFDAAYQFGFDLCQNCFPYCNYWGVGFVMLHIVIVLIYKILKNDN